VKKKIAIIATFLVGLFYFLEFLLPPFVGGDFDNIRTTDPCLVQTDTGYRLYYTGTRSIEGSSDSRLGIGLAESPDGLSWSKHADNPMLARSMFSSNDWRGLSHPAVVQEPDGSFTMFYIGHGSRVGDRVLRATSRDGVAWKRHGPVITPVKVESDVSKQVERASITALAVRRETDGYVAYFGGTYRHCGTTIQGVSRVTSPDGITWALDEQNNPVLAIQPENGWEYKKITDLSVLAVDGELRLYYAGTKTYFLDGGKRVVPMTLVGLATSKDGIAWTRHENNPVFGPGLFQLGLAVCTQHLLDETGDDVDDERADALLERFDACGLSGVSVTRDGERYLLAYCGAKASDDTDYRVGLATSDDGITWQMASAGPAFELGRAPQSTYLASGIIYVSQLLIVVGAMALGLGLFGLAKLHGGKVLNMEKDWVYSMAFFISLVVTLVIAFAWGKEPSGAPPVGRKLYNIIYEGLLVSFGASSMGLLTFYLASSSYRSFKLKNAEAGLMMIAAVLVMLGQVPLGQMLTNALPQAFQIQNISQLMSSTIVNPAMRAIQIGAAVGGLVLATRLWLSMDKKRD